MKLLLDMNLSPREDKTEEQAIAIESALADIQLLGSRAQIAAAVHFMQGQSWNTASTIIASWLPCTA